MKSVQTPLVGKAYRLPFILVTSLFFLWGFAHAILDVLNKHFQEVMNISLTHSALVQVMFYLGYVVMALPAGIYISRRGYRRGVIFGLLLYGVGSLLFIPGAFMHSFVFFLFSLFVIACGLVFLETAANPYVTELGARQTAAARLNFAQAFNGLGCICGPLLGGLVLFSSYDEGAIAYPYALMGVVVLCVALCFRYVRLPEIAQTDADAVGSAPVSRLFANRMFVFGLVALFCYEISEISINSFFINYVTDRHMMDVRTASVMLSFGGLSLFMIGRLVGSFLMRHMAASKLLVICGVGTVLCTLLITLHVSRMAFVALFGVYVFEAIMFPTIFALSVRSAGALTKRASSFLMMSPLGGVVGPLLMGFVADRTDISFSFIVPFCGYVVVLLFAWYAHRKPTFRQI